MTFPTRALAPSFAGAPAFPVIRHIFSLKSLQPARPWMLGGAICLANLHAFWLINNPDLDGLSFGEGVAESERRS